MNRQAQKMLDPFKRKLGQMISRGVLNLVNDALKMQECQLTILADETLDGVERFQNYGFTSVPHAGAESLSLSVGGHRGHSVCIAIDDRRYRLTALADGEVALYTDEGDKLHFKRGRIVNLVTDQLVIDAASKVTINSPLLDMPAGQINTSGNVISAADVVASGISLTGHTHPGDSGGTTGAPQ